MRPHRPAALLVTALLVTSSSVAQDQGEPPAAAEAAPPSAAAKGDAEMKKVSLAGYQRAADLYREALRENPSDAELKLKLVQALNAYMRRKTGANLPLVDGQTTDTPENRKVWGSVGAEAVKVAEELVKAQPNNKEVQAAYLEAFMFFSSSYGIVKAVFTGAADTYRDHANALVKLDAAYEGAMGLSYLAAFYFVAPWPLGDTDKSRGFADRAVKASPQSSLAKYWQGLTALKQKDDAVAKAAFEWLRANPCRPATTADYCEKMRTEAGRGLEIIAKR